MREVGLFSNYISDPGATGEVTFYDSVCVRLFHADLDRHLALLAAARPPSTRAQPSPQLPLVLPALGHVVSVATPESYRPEMEWRGGTTMPGGCAARGGGRRSYLFFPDAS